MSNHDMCGKCGDENGSCDCGKHQASNSRLIDGLCGKMFETYNDKLCHAISALAKHHTTQMPIPADDYRKIHNLLMDIRLDIHNNKAT